ncbi:MAG: TrmH family RNA methyltransferase [Acidimicrobiia bacterium]
MAAPVVLTDPDDPRLDDYRFLRDARVRRRLEAPDPAGGGPGFFVAEGPTVIARLIGSGRRVRSVLVDPRRAARLEPLLLTLPAPVYVAERPVLAAACGFDVHRGALAAADRWPLPAPATLLAAARRVAVLEGINDHENLGALFRNAAGLGVDAVLLCPRCADPLYRRSVRVSMGHVLSVPWARLEPWPEALAEVRRGGFAIAALTPAPDAEPLAGVRAEDRLALMFGAEGPGLSPEALARADRRVRIPMAGGADSLNVASAAAVAFYATSYTTSETETT